MKAWLAMLAAVLSMVLCSTVWGADPNGLKFTFWPTVGDSVAELRVGGQWGSLELYGAPRYDKTLEDGGCGITDVRAYAIYNAVSAEMIANLLGEDVKLPDGAAYAGLYGGWAFHEKNWEAGWLAGARIDMSNPKDDKVKIEWAVEYEMSWQSFRGDEDRYVLVTGPRFTLK